jgi:hypothetical protein
MAHFVTKFYLVSLKHTHLCMFFLGLLLLHCDSIPSCGSAEDFLSVEVLYERGVGEYLVRFHGLSLYPSFGFGDFKM